MVLGQLPVGEPVGDWTAVVILTIPDVPQSVGTLLSDRENAECQSSARMQKAFCGLAPRMLLHELATQIKLPLECEENRHAK